MGYVFRPEDAQGYHDWFLKEPGRSAAAIEQELLLQLWAPKSTQRVLEVGCGTGYFLDWFASLGHQVTGIDPSAAMLEIARRRLPGRIGLDLGYAESLPYEDNAFDTVALITTLEFVEDPDKAIREAFRVARRQVLFGALNRFSIGGGAHYVSRLWSRSVYRHAHFFSIAELRQLVEKALAGRVPLRWRTGLSFPLATLRYLGFLERSRYLHWHPFGYFIAMRVDLCYPVQTIQEPLFCDVASRIARLHLPTSCWRLPREKPLGERLLPRHREPPTNRGTAPS